MSKVLIVEDSIDCAQPLKRLLQMDGHEVESAQNGREALKVAEWFRPDKVVTDLMMPEMDGLTFIRTLRRDPRFSGLPVVVFTAWGDPKIRRRLEELEVGAVHMKGSLDVPALLKSVQAG
jgi:two-component system, chemotaxis family, chemotaxis protein CheY